MDMADNCCGRCSRRKFIVSSTKAVLGAAVTIELLNSCNTTPANIVGDNEKKIAIIDLTLYTELKQIGGSAKIYDIEEYPLIGYRKSETEIVIVYSACTHQGVEIELPNEKGVAECPHDHATFDLNEEGKALLPDITNLALKSYYGILNEDSLTIYEK